MNKSSPFCHVCGTPSIPGTDRCPRHTRLVETKPDIPLSQVIQLETPDSDPIMTIPVITLSTSPSFPRCNYFLGILLSPGESAQKTESNSKEEIETWARVMLIKTDKERHKTRLIVHVYEIRESLIEIMSLNPSGHTFTTETPK